MIPLFQLEVFALNFAIRLKISALDQVICNVFRGTKNTTRKL